MSRKSILISALLLISACGSHHRRSLAPTAATPTPTPDKPTLSVKPLALQGKVDLDLQGGWRSCIPEGEGSHLLSYDFQAQGLVVKDGYDPINAHCESPAWITTYRFDLQLSSWVPNKLQTRTLPAALKQVTAYSTAEQLTHFFNRDAQCGINDWVTGQERDITGLLCLGLDAYPGLAVPGTYPAPFTLQVVHKENAITLTADAGFKQLFVAGNSLTVSDGRDLRVKFWNNAIPRGAIRTYTMNLPLIDQPNWEGKGWFYLNGFTSGQAVTVKEGVMTLTVEVPDVMPAATLSLQNGTFTDTHTKEQINFRYDSGTGKMQFTDRADNKLSETTTAAPIFSIPAGLVVDTAAPTFELLGQLPSTLKRQESLDIRFKATDDVSGVYAVTFFSEGRISQTTFFNLVYEGQDVYRITLYPASLDANTRITGMAIYDRVSFMSTRQAVAITVVD